MGAVTNSINCRASSCSRHGHFGTFVSEFTVDYGSHDLSRLLSGDCAIGEMNLFISS